MEKELQHMVMRVYCIDRGFMRMLGWESRFFSTIDRPARASQW